MTETTRDALISQYTSIYESKRYGDTSIKNLRFVLPQVAALKPASILDYGCGRSKLVDALSSSVGATASRYDPAIAEFSERPTGQFDLLINIDVLEHIPEDDLDAVLGEMRALCREALIVIDTRPAETLLPDGSNAHCTLHDHAWWHERLARTFGHVHPIQVARRSRAAFRTWSLSPAEDKQVGRAIFRERLAYRWMKLFQRSKPGSAD
ncbi:MAG: methyltransferase domain-containing protein [Pseudomonadota bacterium]